MSLNISKPSTIQIRCVPRLDLHSKVFNESIKGNAEPYETTGIEARQGAVLTIHAKSQYRTPATTLCHVETGHG